MGILPAVILIYTGLLVICALLAITNPDVKIVTSIFMWMLGILFFSLAVGIVIAGIWMLSYKGW